jgi:uncharacterized protein (TIGR02099 family)
LTQYRIFSKIRQSVTADKLGWLGSGTLWVYRILTWGLLAAAIAVAAVVISLRYWILPNVENYREDIARIVSERARQKVTIEKIRANWDGLRPQLLLENLVVHDAAGRASFRLARIDLTLSWLSAAMMELRFYALDIYRPTLHVRRDAGGAVSIAGIEISGDGGDSGFSDWLLRQRDIEVHDATLVWTDERRQAPPLELKSVFLRVQSRGGRHRFGLRAVPPAALAAPVDVRGDVSGASVRSLADWNGRLYLQLDYADLAAWRAWIDYPIDLPRGAGAVRAWLSFQESRLSEAIADVRLAGVRTRLAADLPELDLSELNGRIGWKQSASSVEITTSRLGLVTTGGLALPPADFLLRHAAGEGKRLARGEMQVNALELAPLAALAEHLPIGEDARKRLTEYAPRGAIFEVVARWTGDWREPQSHSVRGRFENLALNRSGRIPGFTGVSGTVESGERGGTLALNSHKTTVEMPLVFRDPLDFDSLTAQLSWTRGADGTDLKMNGISFSNAHLAGTVFGNYRGAASSRGVIDLTGRLTRADARYVSRYIPLVVGKGARDWLDNAFIAGQSSEVTLRLKGDLDGFPFPDGRDGLFQVTAKVTGGVLNYANGWPQIENIAGDLVFRGKRMDVHARQGTILGARLGKVHVELPDLVVPEGKMLNVNGEAEGPTSEFFSFIDKSPVLGMIDRFVEGWQVQGAGKLSLKLAIPLTDLAKTRVTGAYQFAGNNVSVSPELPAVEQATGRVEFTETGVRVPNVSGMLLGGPVTISAAPARDSTVRVSLQGRVNVDGVRKAGGPSWIQHLRGTTDWKAVINARKRNADVVVESSLQGLAVDLPAPVVKAAAETMPLRIERRLLAAGQDRLSLAIGEVVSLNVLRRTEGERSTITRGTVRFGGPAAEPERAGVWVSGSVKTFDADRWLALLAQGGGDTRVEWGGVDVKFDALDVARRRFSDFAANVAVQGGQWRGSVSAKELDGTVTWLPQGRGKLVARMKTLAIPAAAPGAAPDDGDKSAQKDSELPALDIIAEQFSNKGRQLGRLELAAVPEGREWRIEKLRIANPESTFALDGTWQPAALPPRTQVNIKLEASDVGKLLTRLGFPEGVRRGTTKIEGALAWNGTPYDMDYASLSGNFVLDAAKGQFVKLEPGIGKLLGILSLQSLPRRISLDFRDVLSEGYSFDEISAAIKVNRGIASTDNLRIVSPAARVAMSGEVDLARETQKLKVRVSPHLSDTVSIAGALVGGPIAGVAAFIAQKMLKDPLDQAASFEYSVTGTWADPAVTRLDRAPVASPEGTPGAQ